MYTRVRCLGVCEFGAEELSELRADKVCSYSGFELKS